jgi:hypothetical protein
VHIVEAGDERNDGAHLRFTVDHEPSADAKNAPGATAWGTAASAPPALVAAMQVIQRDASVASELVGAVRAIREVPLRA